MRTSYVNVPQGVSSGLLPPTSTPESADDEVSEDEDGNEAAASFKRRFFQQQDLGRRSNTADSSLRNHHHNNVPSVLHRQVMFVLTHSSSDSRPDKAVVRVTGGPEYEKFCCKIGFDSEMARLITMKLLEIDWGV